MNYQQITREYQRLNFMNYAGILADDGYEVKLTSEADDDWILEVTVPGATRFPVKFSYFGIDQELVSLSAFFVSPLLDEGLVDMWSITTEDEPEEICRELIIPFVWECFDAEFNKVLVPTMINDDNVKYFGPLLSDTILDEENTYGLGVYIKDEGGLEIAAAAGFYVSDGNLVIDSVTVRPQYNNLDIEQYLVRYIKRMIVDLKLN